MKYFMILLMCIGVMVGCGEKASETGKQKPSQTPTGKSTVVVKNKFNDPGFQAIYTLQNQRDSQGLIKYLSNENPRYRQAAATALASVQASETVKPLVTCLSDKEEAVRIAAAYALGQVGDKAAEPLLINAFEAELSPVVKRELMEALGKCATAKGLEYLTGSKVDTKQFPGLLLTGKAWGIYRAALNNIVSPAGTQFCVSMHSPDMPQNGRFAAAHYLARVRQLDLRPFGPQLLAALDRESNLDIKMALTAALGKAKTPEVKEKLQTIVNPGQKNPVDYRIVVNALRALGQFDYIDVKDTMLALTQNSHSQVSFVASGYLLSKGKAEDAGLYFETAQNVNQWRSRATLLGAALKFFPQVDTKNRKRVSDWTSAAFKKTANLYEKAELIGALTWDLENFTFMQSQVFHFAGQEAVIATNGMNALAAMYRRLKESRQLNAAIKDDFARLFQRAIESRDSSLITIGAEMLRDPKMELKSAYKDTAFLTAAFDNLQIPQQREAQLELQKTIAFFNGKTGAEPTPLRNKAIDWEQVTAVSPEQQVRIKTSKGDIIIGLFLNDSPGSVVNFLSLIRENYYKSSVFHRVAANFVIQDGCPRGDGWGGPSYVIGSELGPLRYETGSLGMASSGKDTEGSQWFITHSPTPHLDGRYSIFGKVLKGMEVVHQIEVGDRLLGFDVL